MYPRLRDLRQDQDLTQKQLAALLKMSQTGYSKYETGETTCPPGCSSAWRSCTAPV